jgi:hypothetical protein
MRHALLLSLILLAAPAAAFGQDDNTRATSLAKELLERGAALFDKRDAAAMAATYLDAAEIIVLKHDSESNRMVVEAKHGRAEIEQAYAEIFKDRLPEHRCRNTVEAARFLSPDVLIIRGRFALNREQGDALQFVQVRARDGDQWKIATMQLIELPK